MKKIIAFIFTAVLCIIAIIPAAAEGVTVEVSDFSVTTGASESEIDSISKNITITNNNSYPIYGISLTSSEAYDALEAVPTDISAASVIEPGQSVTLPVAYLLNAEESETTAEKSSGCSSSLSLLAVLPVVALLLFFSVRGKDKFKKCGIIMLALLCCMPVLCTPANAEESDTASAPTVTISSSDIDTDGNTYTQLHFNAVYSDNSKTQITTELMLTAGENTYNTQVTFEYSECLITGYGMRSVPISGIATLPIAVQRGKEVDLTAVYGTDIPTEKAEGNSFTGTYPDRIYTSEYYAKFDTLAYVTYTLRGVEGIVWSDLFTTSVKKTAETKISDGTLSDEEINNLKTSYINKAGRTASVSEEDENALREKIVGKMDEMASVKWRTRKSLTTGGLASFTTPTYLSNKQYVGLIYNQNAYGTAEAFSYLIDDEGYIEEEYTKDVDTLWYNTPGVSCSTAVTGAYAYYVTGITSQIGATNMIPSITSYGFAKLGTYKVPAGSQTTDVIIKANKADDIYKAYAQMKAGDMLVRAWYTTGNVIIGHILMVRETPTIVYYDDGTINPYLSKVKTVEQHSLVTVVDGNLTTWLNAETTFAETIQKYVPIQYTKLTSDYATPLFCMISSGFNPGQILKNGLTGILESDFPVRWVSVSVTDTEGNTVYERKYTPEGSYAKNVLFTNMKDINEGLKSVASGTYTVKISALVKDTEKVLYEGTEIK